MVRATIYKEGILKRARILFADGRYEDTIKELKKGFDLEAIKIFKKNGEYKPKQKDKDKNDNFFNLIFLYFLLFCGEIFLWKKEKKIIYRVLFLIEKKMRMNLLKILKTQKI